VSDPVAYRSGIRPDAVVRQIATPTAQVTGAVAAPQAYPAFAEYLDTALPPLGSVYSIGGTRAVPAASPGTFVLFSSVTVLTADVSRHCGNAVVSGRVTSWSNTNDGILACGVPLPEAQLAHTLSDMACGKRG
jgi:hypothetical protein